MESVTNKNGEPESILQKTRHSDDWWRRHAFFICSGSILITASIHLYGASNFSDVNPEILNKTSTIMRKIPTTFVRIHFHFQFEFYVSGFSIWCSKCLLLLCCVEIIPIFDDKIESEMENYNRQYGMNT